MTIISVNLVALGVLVLAYSGIFFATPGQPANSVGMHVETTEWHFMAPVVGALVFVGGIGLLLVNPKRAA